MSPLQLTQPTDPFDTIGSLQLRNGAFPERANQPIDPELLLGRIKQAGLFPKRVNISLTTAGTPRDSEVYDLQLIDERDRGSPKSTDNKISALSEKLPYWLPKLVQCLITRGIKVYTWTEAPSMLETQVASEWPLNSSSFVLKRPDHLASQTAIIIHPRQFFFTRPEPSLIVQVKAALSAADGDTTQANYSGLVREKFELLLTTSDLSTPSQRRKTLAFRSPKVLIHRATMLRELSNADDNTFSQEDKSQANGKLQKTVGCAMLEKYHPPSVYVAKRSWHPSDTNITKGIALTIDPEEILPVYVNLKGLYDQTKYNFTVNEGQDWLRHQCAVFRKLHCQVSPKRSPKCLTDHKRYIWIPTAYKRTAIVEAPIQSINSGPKPLLVEIKGSGTDEPTLGTTTDGVLRADSGLRELFAWTLLATFLELPVVQNHLTKLLARDPYIDQQDRQVKRIKTIGVLGLSFIPNLKTNSKPHFPHTPYCSLLTRPVHERRDSGYSFQSKSHCAHLVNFIEINIFHRLGIGSWGDTTNIQGYYSNETETFYIIDHGTTEPLPPSSLTTHYKQTFSSLARMPFIFDSQPFSDEWMKDTADGIIAGKINTKDIIGILAYIQNWVKTSFSLY